MKFEFPTLPQARIYSSKMTSEQEVLMKLIQGQIISTQEEDILKAAIKFYKKAFEYLKSIDLSTIVEEDLEEIFDFLKSVFNMNLIIQNQIKFHNVFRVTIVSDIFLENGKVRDTKYIKNPPKEIIIKNGVYGRANSPKSTIFYCAFEPGVAVLETKPEVGQRIIIAQWHNDNAKDFISYPITNNKTIDNESLKSATNAFQKRIQYNHPLFVEILDLYLDFLSSEFVKDIKVTSPKKYEYLFSAYFADRILDNSFEPVEHPTEPIKHYDCIIYPSIAINHKSENLAILPQSIDKLRPFQLEDCIVVKTMYDNPDLEDDKLPILRQVLRTATKFDGDKIIWDDDEE